MQDPSRFFRLVVWGAALVAAAVLFGCGSDDDHGPNGSGSSTTGDGAGASTTSRPLGSNSEGRDQAPRAGGGTDAGQDPDAAGDEWIASEFARRIGGSGSPDGPERFETAIARYRRPADGVTVDLVAEIHIADPEHYREIQRRLANYDAVLYELVADDGDRPAPGHGVSDSVLSMVYRQVGSTLGLAFQLEALDYSKPNFIHADFTKRELAEAFEEAGESLVGLMIRDMVKSVFRERDENDAQRPMQDMVAALRDNTYKLALRHQFVDVLLDVGVSGDALEGTVLLDGRNERALEVMNREIQAGRKNLAIHYGAGHMRGLEKRLVADLGFEKVSHDWVIAWRLDPGILDDDEEDDGEEDGEKAGGDGR